MRNMEIRRRMLIEIAILETRAKIEMELLRMKNGQGRWPERLANSKPQQTDGKEEDQGKVGICKLDGSKAMEARMRDVVCT